jgi:chromosome segregation ATPase
MEEGIAKEIQRLKEELDRKRGEIEDIRELVKKEIDREWPVHVEELSEKELETYIKECVSSIETHIDPKPDKKGITSPRKILGRPIIFFKRALIKMTGVYVHLLLDKQTQFNRQSVSLYRALALRLQHLQEKIKYLQERVSDGEESLVILEKKLEDLQASQEQLKSRTANHNLTAKD